MTVYFANKDPIDVSAIELMGVSVKETKSPIGFFGTGLKFAIATLLRTGHTIVLERAGEAIRFETIEEEIRGEKFQRVIMRRPFAETPAHVPLGFTTQLGRNWEPWQAYRELRSNCMDEGGVTGSELPPGQWGTVFAVAGEGIERAHAERASIFLESRPLVVSEECNIHSGESTLAYYRGVRAGDLQLPALFTYDLRSGLVLTEDRTIRDWHMVPYLAGRAIANCLDEDVIEACVMAPRSSFEYSLAFNHGETPSETFMKVVERNRRSIHLNLGALKLWEQYSDSKSVYDDVTIDELDEDNIQRALVLTRRLGCDLDRAGFKVVETLGAGAYGRYRKGEILLAREALDKGYRFIASTLYEEWLHKMGGYADESRALQSVLFERLLSMTERIVELEKRNKVS